MAVGTILATIFDNEKYVSMKNKNDRQFVESVASVRDVLAEKMMQIVSDQQMDLKSLKEIATVIKEVDRVVREYDCAEETNGDDGLDFLERLGRRSIISKKEENEEENVQ